MIKVRMTITRCRRIILEQANLALRRLAIQAQADGMRSLLKGNRADGSGGPGVSHGLTGSSS